MVEFLIAENVAQIFSRLDAIKTRRSEGHFECLYPFIENLIAKTGNPK